MTNKIARNMETAAGKQRQEKAYSAHTKGENHGRQIKE
jgi:hypothetical protein